MDFCCPRPWTLSGFIPEISLTLPYFPKGWNRISSKYVKNHLIIEAYLLNKPGYKGTRMPFHTGRTYLHSTTDQFNVVSCVASFSPGYRMVNMRLEVKWKVIKKTVYFHDSMLTTKPVCLAYLIKKWNIFYT